ncbi:type II secretion system F family protein [Phycicoccus sp. CSK15P-2]|uniref:type II secretion system F family protein n=1 Tax=Phycicoccus sp. CSK15P-2 TaxID=2807627 RepID=UPI0019514D16|nr:type II secretion system F family protein [Phycicoccus sp. CSK15P-2]MBM6404372.1 type II secretion system F family protein [Phycicoccus sp. CSK15P-2]
MSGLLVGLGVGVGLFLVWWSMWVPTPDEPRPGRRGGPISRLSDEVVQAGFAGLSVRTLLVACVLAFLLVLAIVQLTIGVLPIAVCFATIAGGVPIGVVRRRARARRAVLRDLWPEAVDNITSAVRAGLALPEALAQLGERGPEELRDPFRQFADDYRLTGRFADCLDRLKERLSDPVGDRLVESLRIAREVGGSDLGRLLRTLSTFLREDARTRAELETRQSWTVNAARLAVAAPWLILALLSSNPRSVAAYSTALGAAVLAAGAAVTGLAYWVMMRIGRLPEERRVLR